MEAVAVLVSVVPLVLIMALLVRLLQRRGRPVPRATQPGGFPGGRSRPLGAGDRSPRRPLVPSMAGAVALPEPRVDDLR